MTNVNAVLNKLDFVTTITNDKGHTWLVDEPELQGGKNAGPNPHDLLAAALASCTAITLKMYANRKEWKLETVNVNVTILQNDKTTFNRTIELVGSFTIEQKQRLLHIANACPIHKLLINQSEIKTEIV